LRGFCGVSSDGLSGGLALFWDESIQVTVLESTARFIDVIVVDPTEGLSWRTTFIYGEPRVENRHLMWESLIELRAQSQQPWLDCGDYNEAMWQHEHFSNSLHGENQMAAFRDTLTLCELQDLGFLGTPYTYDNKRVGVQNVRVRLDRACADMSWIDIFPLASVKHLTSPRSDHCPILIHAEVEDPTQHRRSSPRYEIMWERESSLHEVVQQA
jgi:hypothetical protein